MRAAKIYRPDEVRGTATAPAPGAEDYRARIRRVLWIHRWLPAPDGNRLAQLKAGGSSWPMPVPDGKGPRPCFSPAEISDHDLIFGLTEACRPWFRGLSNRSFEILYQRDAYDWSFTKIGDAYGISRQRAHTVYNQALIAVVTDAVRGGFEI